MRLTAPDARFARTRLGKVSGSHQPREPAGQARKAHAFRYGGGPEPTKPIRRLILPASGPRFLHGDYVTAT